MRISTLQWNIGGARILTPDCDPKDYDAYKQEGIEHIITVINECKPDIVTMQETHATPALVQADVIAQRTGLRYHVNNSYDRSHIEKGQDLGQAVLTRFSILREYFTPLHNPQYKRTLPDGEILVSHNKLLTECQLRIADDSTLTVYTLHMTPFQFFNVNHLGEETAKIREDLAKKLQIKGNCIIQGDFNIDSPSLKAFMPAWFKAGLQEVTQNDATRPKGQRHDHVLYKGLRLVSSRVLSALTDHYPIYSEFETQ